MTATPVEKTYVMLMVADMTRALRFYTEAFDVTVVISSPHWSEFTVAGTTIALHPGGSGDQTRTGLGSKWKILMLPFSGQLRLAGASAPRSATDRRSGSESPNLSTPREI
jgi:extradiol dioxygenase family protein